MRNSLQTLYRRAFAAIFAAAVLTPVLAPDPAAAGEASVLDVVVTARANGTYNFSVTIAHKDEGWGHYSNKFDVVDPAGKTIGTRTLYHPHVNEQPFTRSLTNVAVPLGVTEVTIRAHDSKHKWGKRTVTVKLPKRK